MLVLEAHLDTDPGGAVRVLTRSYTVLGLAILPGPDLIITPVFVLDGDLTTLDAARRLVWGPCTVDEIVVCDWPKHCDQRMLGRRLTYLIDEVEARYAEREKGQQTGGNGLPFGGSEVN